MHSWGERGQMSPFNEGVIGWDVVRVFVELLTGELIGVTSSSIECN